ncbi:hypothetical protein HBN95_04000 [Chlamydia buteonis]|uniref:hypothetical protein n=1 Tax=Chlamydia buteonis TaxID=2494525 RepID=UPI001C2CC37B|nr:hypothetical protein [Chlamydia buteonis]QXE27279.1 hypothetical protein HBN95_04000 [Chlamydia buteonis]
MCCPPGGCSCKLTLQERGGDSSQANIPLQQIVVTQQPGKRVSLDLQVGDTPILETIQKAGVIATSLLNAPQTQRGANYCHEHCSPWCDSHCPNWLSHCFHCLCTCIINPPPDQPSGAHPDLLQFLDTMKHKHGPIVLGMGAQQSNMNWPILLAEGQTLPENQKAEFDQLCLDIKENLKKLLAGGIQQELFDLANDPSEVPKINETDTIMTKRGYGDFLCKRQDTPPPCWIIYNKGEEQALETAQSVSAIHYTKQINYSKLLSQLYQLNVMDLCSGDTFPLGGKDGKNALCILKNTLSCLVGNAPCFAYGRDGFSLSLHPKKLLKLIILVLLALGYVPISSGGESPKATLDELKKVSEFLKLQWDAYGRAFLPGDPDNPFDDSEVDGLETDSSRNHQLNSTDETDSDKGDDDWLSNSAQEQLLGMTQTINSLLALLG